MNGTNLHMMCLAGALTAPLMLRGQITVPYTAHYVETMEDTASGTVDRQEGLLERSSSGSLLTTRFARGTERTDYRTLYDASSATLYTLRDTDHTAAGVASTLGPVAAKGEPIGHEVVAGVSASVYPLYSGREKQKVVGKVWIADCCGLLVRSHSEHDGVVHDYILTNLTMYREPTAADFKIPAGYQISKPQS